MDAGVTPHVFRRIALKVGEPHLVGSQEYLRMRYGMDAEAITETVCDALGMPESGSELAP
jgi:hypothetical protein